VGKVKLLKEELKDRIDEIIDTAAQVRSLDYFNIEISNHEGKLNVEYKLKDRSVLYGKH